MKKLVLVLGLCFAFQAKAHAIQSTVWLSSNTATATASTTTLCGQYIVNGATSTLRGVLHGICINTASAGSVAIFPSTYTYTSSITGTMSTGTQQPCNFYDALSSNGLSYNKNGTADITILYICY